MANAVTIEDVEVAVLIPCYNEAPTIAKVIGDFRRELPMASIYVYDNDSTDETANLAEQAGATVVFERRQGKGFVVQAMFNDVDADVYVIVDGDDTYPADKVHELLQPILAGQADMVVGNRLVQFREQSFRPFHVFGNRLVVWVVNQLFGANVRDVLSGYRAFDREMVRAIPVSSKGFEIETELTLQTLYRSFVLVEVPVPYGIRPAGSFSKLSTLRDGFRVLLKVFDIVKAYRPLLFFGSLGILLGACGVALGFGPFVEFVTRGRISHFPAAFVAATLTVMALVSIGSGVVLDSLNHQFRELSQLLLRRTSQPRYGRHH